MSKAREKIIARIKAAKARGKCGICKETRLTSDKRKKSGICAKCEATIRKTGCVCHFLRHMGNGRYLTSNMDACPIHGFGEP